MSKTRPRSSLATTQRINVKGLGVRTGLNSSGNARISLSRPSSRGQAALSQSQKNLKVLKGYVKKSLVDILDREVNRKACNVCTDDNTCKHDHVHNLMQNES